MSKPHLSIDWAGTLEGHIILNIDEPYKTPALKALAGLVEQLEELNQMALHEIRRADEAEEQFKVEYGRGFADAGEQCKGLEEQLEAQREVLADLIEAVDAACEYDSKQAPEDMWSEHIRSVLELALQRARETSSPASEPEP